MSVFQYYIPKVEKKDITRELLLSYAFAPALKDLLRNDAEFKRIGLLNVATNALGPSGCVVVPQPVDQSDVERMGIYPDHQKWHDCGDYQVGFDLEHPPTPQGLLRPRVVSGYDHQLGDENWWTCPVIRWPGNIPNLPQSWSMTNGQLDETILPEFVEPWEMSAEIFDIFSGLREIEKREAFQYATKCLALNYRLGPVEVSMLGLLTSDNYWHVVKASIDGEAIEEYLSSKGGKEWIAESVENERKKKVDSSDTVSPTIPGDKGCSPDTVPVEETSTS